MLRIGSLNTREWYVEEFINGNHYHKIHKSFKYVFKSEEDAKRMIAYKISREGGIYLDRLPVQGRIAYKKRMYGY